MFRPQPPSQSTSSYSSSNQNPFTPQHGQQQQQPSFNQPHQQQQQQQQPWATSSSGRPASQGGNTFSQFGGNSSSGYSGGNGQFSQSSPGAGGGGGGGAGGVQGGQTGAFGESGQRKKYLPGYLSGALGQSQAQTSNQHDDGTNLNSMGGQQRSQWGDSPNKSLNSGSPASRLNQSLFGSSARTDGTPTKGGSNLRSGQGGGGQGDHHARVGTAFALHNHANEMEEDAPPIESLGEREAQEGSLYSTNGIVSFDHDHRPSPPSHTLSDSQLPTSSTSPSSQTPSKGHPITIYGFPPSALPYVLSHFSQFGNIISSHPGPEGSNWVTVIYTLPWSAARAQRRDGEVLGGIMMVGVRSEDEEALRSGLGGEVGISGGVVPLGGGGGKELMPSTPKSSSITNHTSTSTSTPTTSTSSSSVGKPIPILGPSSAFKPTPTTPRRGFFSATAGTPSQTSSPLQTTTLFGEKSKAALGQGEGAVGGKSGEKGIVGRVGDLVFGW